VLTSPPTQAALPCLAPSDIGIYFLGTFVQNSTAPFSGHHPPSLFPRPRPFFEDSLPPTSIWFDLHYFRIFPIFYSPREIVPLSPLGISPRYPAICDPPRLPPFPGSPWLWLSSSIRLVTDESPRMLCGSDLPHSSPNTDIPSPGR